MSTNGQPVFEQTDDVKFLVDDVPYVIAKDVLTKYPESYFCQLLSKSAENTTNKDHQVAIKGRDKESAELFIYIYEYLRYGCLPRDFDGECLLLKEALPLLRKEAEFYMIKALIDEIDDELNGGVKRHKKQARLQAYRKTAARASDIYAIGGHSALKEDTAYLSVISKFHDGYVECGPLNKLDVDSILDHCSELTYVDQTFSFKRSNNSSETKALEIGAAKLKIHQEGFETPEVIKKILDCVTRELFNAEEPGGYKLVFQDSGDCPILYGEDDVGTLLVCLPNEHKGGELSVQWNDQSCAFNFDEHSNDHGIVQFVAVDKGSQYQFATVTTGFQIILTYTIQRSYELPPEKQPDLSTVVTAKSGLKAPGQPVKKVELPPEEPEPEEPTEPVEEPVVPVVAAKPCCTIM